MKGTLFAGRQRVQFRVQMGQCYYQRAGKLIGEGMGGPHLLQGATSCAQRHRKLQRILSVSDDEALRRVSLGVHPTVEGGVEVHG